MRAELQPAYILHTRAYRDTSLLVDIFSANYGRLSLIAKGARKPKQYQRHLLQPFIPLLISWQGKGQLKTLLAVEASAPSLELQGRFLYSGLYLNELLNYILPPNDASQGVFELYVAALDQLRLQVDLECCLRQFEFLLLSELGYGIDFTMDIANGQPIKETSVYRFVVEQGFVEVLSDIGEMPCYPGGLLIAIAHQQFDCLEVRRAAKAISRQALAPYLQGRELKSRELFKRG